MDILNSLAGTSEYFDRAFLHIEAWRDDVSQSAIATSLQMCNAFNNHFPATEYDGEGDEYPVAASSDTEVSTKCISHLANLNS
jgi:hypothetical protein